MIIVRGNPWNIPHQKIHIYYVYIIFLAEPKNRRMAASPINITGP